MALPPDTLAEQVAYNVSGDVACTDNWPAIREAIVKRTEEALAAQREQLAKIADDYGEWTYWGQSSNAAAAEAAAAEIAKAIRLGRWLTTEEVTAVDQERAAQRKKQQEAAK